MPRYTFICHTGKTGGIAQGHIRGRIPFIPDYTAINRRINRLYIKIKDADIKSKEFKDEYIIIAIDSTGIKVNRGQWMREMESKEERIFENTYSS
jgi:hypothetical protein